MKKLLLLICLLIILPSQSIWSKSTNEPDSVYIFAYSTSLNKNRNGLHFAWSTDRKAWNAIGPEFRFLTCDYGNHGTEKKMISPYLFLGPDKLWHCVWSVNDRDGVFAHTSSTDLIHWRTQSYPTVMKDGNCQEPEICFDKSNQSYAITWVSGKAQGLSYRVTTRDFKTYSPAQPIPVSARLNKREDIQIEGNTYIGIVNKVAWKVVEDLQTRVRLADNRNKQNRENMSDDSVLFLGLKKLDAIITANLANSKKISDKLIGAFFEDISYAADGGLYAELIQNRDFEYALSDKDGQDKTWNSTKSWSLNGSNGMLCIDSISPIHPNNMHYAVLKINTPGARLVNEGFDGIALKAGDKYDFSVFVRNADGKGKKLLIRLIGVKGEVYGETTVNANSPEWKKYTAVLTAGKTVADARLEIVPQATGTIELDMISLFPQKTFMGRKNGLRADLAQMIADIHPKFVRFPGGCVTHGDGLHNIYRWKNTIGPLEARNPLQNIWRYHQSMGLGYYEYFQFCEDMGAEPLPVIAAGVPCQNSSVGGTGQQGGIPMNEMGQYIQDILDLIEWANGDVNTKWGKVRAEAGHPKPFNLKYIGIGNEDLISDIFEERFALIFKAIKEQHSEITVIGTVGPLSEGPDYEEGWRVATELKVPMVDEHYYQPVGWFLNNQDFYDKYDRSKSKVYLGEYASRGNTLANALTEALYLNSIERNGDVVSMTSYAPLLAKEGHVSWKPDLIFFNNSELKPTVNYYVQKLFGQNQGDAYIASDLKLSENNEEVRKRISVSIVRDSKSNDLIVKLVNILPVEVNTTVNLEGPEVIVPTATSTVLRGTVGDTNVKPEGETITVSKKFSCSLPAYSFTVIRIHPIKKK
jgi:Alpha-L-arabinofuranosidase